MVYSFFWEGYNQTVVSSWEFFLEISIKESYVYKLVKSLDTYLKEIT